jgi:hypothetical protein
MAKLYKARDTFTVVVDGVPVIVKKGEIAEAGAAIMKGGRDELFEEASEKDYIRFPSSGHDNAAALVSVGEVEQATAAPGEKRGSRRSSGTRKSTRRKSTASKAGASSSKGITSSDVPGA